MARSEFNVKEQWIGTSALTDYDFDFKIEDLEHLLLIVQDDSGAVIQRVRGSDTSYFSGVVFDSVAGGGTISLLAVLPTDYVLTALLANDLPTQPSEFRGKFGLNLPAIEAALDWLGGALQRVSYLAQRAVRLHDVDDADTIDLTLPVNFALNPGATIVINDDGTGLDYGATVSQIADASNFRDEAEQFAIAAAADAAAADVSAAAAAAAVISVTAGNYVVGTRAAPGLIANGATLDAPNSARREIRFVKGNGGNVTVAAITPGTTIGQELIFVGRDDGALVTIPNGIGTSLSGDAVLGEDESVNFWWDGTNWSELLGRR